MRVRLNSQSIEWLYAKRIFFQGFGKKSSRLKPGELLTFPTQGTTEPYCAVYNGHQICKMGMFSYTWSPLPVDATIGRYCSISWDVKFPGPNHPHQLLSTSLFITGSSSDIWSVYLEDTNKEFKNIQPNPQKPGPIIGHDVWIGQDVSVMRGLRIGDGAVVAASSVVTKDVPPFAIVGGNPAQFIRWRFPPDIIEELTELRWWRHDYAVLNKINLSDIKSSIRDLRWLLADVPDFQPGVVKFTEMPFDQES